MRKILSVVLSVMLGLGVIGCNREPIGTTADNMSEESSIPSEASTEAPEEDLFRVCVVLNSVEEMKADAERFVQGAEEAAEDLEIELELFYGQNQMEWNAGIKTACEAGADLIVAVSPEIADSITEYAPMYPKVRFVVLDAEVQEPNVQSYYLEYEDAFFQAGKAAAAFTIESDVEGINGESVIGWIGGMNIPVIHGYLEAYEQGAKTVNPEIQVLEAYVGGWNEPEKGREVAERLMKQGADVIAFVASDSGTGIMEAVQEYGVYAIKMEQDSEVEETEQILGIIEENMNHVADRMIHDGAKDDFKGGTVQVLTGEEGMVGFSEIRPNPESLDKEYKAY